MHWFAHHIIDPGGKEIERLFERGRFVHRDHRRPGPLLDDFRVGLAVTAIPEQESLNGAEVGFGDRRHPFPEILRAKSGGGYAFTAESAGVSRGHDLPFINDYKHMKPPDSKSLR